MAGSFPPNYTPPPPSSDGYARQQRDYNIAVNKEKIALAAKLAAAEAAASMKAVLKKTKITAYEISGGKVYLNLLAGIDVAGLEAQHVIEGIPITGIQGRIEPDFSFQTGSTVNVKYDTSAANIPFTATTTPAYVYSVNTSKGETRTAHNEDYWNKRMAFWGGTINNRKLGYNDMPNWDDSLNSNRVAVFGVVVNCAPPTSPGARRLGGGIGGVDGTARDDVYWYWTLIGYAKYCEQNWRRKIKEAKAAKQALDTAKGVLGVDVKPDKPDGSGKSGKTGNTTTTTTQTQASGNLSGIGDDTKPVIHNLPAVKEMYFRSDDLQNFKVNSGNLSKRVDEAKKLWADSSSYKGMIQSFIVPAQLNGNTWWNPAGSKGLQGNNKRINTRRYGFQFQYNPSTVTMAYAGAPQVDIGLETSGDDKVPLIGSSVTSSTVTFNVIINRMNDFKYLDSLIYDTSEARYIEAFVPARGKVKLNNLSSLFGEVYSHTGNHPVQRQNSGAANEVSSINDELTQIKELGTMYDIEYLLRTLLGYQLKSNLRNVFTSDIGYLGAYPVELHLGNNLRYLGIIDGFNVSHTIFNQNMVPVFSNVSITFSRLPDFAKPFNEVTVTKTIVDTKKDEES